MKMIINPDVAKTSTDLSATPAFSDGTAENTVYWTEMTKAQVKQFFDVAMGYMVDYVDCVGSTLAAEILGALEDTYPEWVEEFEDALA